MCIEQVAMEMEIILKQDSHVGRDANRVPVARLFNLNQVRLLTSAALYQSDSARESILRIMNFRYVKIKPCLILRCIDAKVLFNHRLSRLLLEKHVIIMNVESSCLVR